MTAPRPPLPDQRAEVLSAIRAALAPSRAVHTQTHTPDTPDPKHRPPLWPDFGGDLIATFTTAARKVGTEVLVAPDLEHLLTRLAAELRRDRNLPADHPLVIARPPFTEPLDSFAVDIAIVPATLGIATLGSVLLEGPRLPPMTAEITVALLAQDHLVPTLHEALRSHRPGPTRLLVTGPSKTADIEGVLITGVHGPRRFIVALGATQ